MKTKHVNNAQEKCDEWLSTRNKKKISKPIPLIKKHSAARSFVKSGSSSKLCKLTQNSPPPPQIFTNTKQSVLMSYFNSKSDSSSEQNQGFDDLNDFDVDMQEELTEQFGFLSPDESNEKERHQSIPLSYSIVAKKNSTKCQVKCDIDASNDDSDDCKMSERFIFSPKCDKNVISVGIQNHFDDIEFVSQSNAEQTRNVEQKKNSIQIKKSNSKTDSDSDIEFISQCPTTVGINVNPPNSKAKSAIKHNRPTSENIGKTLIKGNVNSKTDTDSDIEFIGQSPKNARKYVNPQNSSVKAKISRHIPQEKRFNKHRRNNKFQSDTSSDDIEFLSQCPELKSRQMMNTDLSISNQKKHLNSKRCQSSKIPKPDSDGSDIEFYSQILERGRHTCNSNKVVPTIPENTQELSRQVPKDYHIECQHSVDNVKNMKLKCNKDPKMVTNPADNGMECVPEILSDGNEIDFISQSVLHNPKTSLKFCDSLDSTNHFQNHTLNVTLNTEELYTPHIQDFDFDSQEDDSCSTDTLQPEEQCLEQQILTEQSQTDSQPEQSPKHSLPEQSPKNSLDELSPQQSLEEQSETDSQPEQSPKHSQPEQSPKNSLDEQSPHQSLEEQSQGDSLKEQSPKHIQDEQSPHQSLEHQNLEYNPTNELLFDFDSHNNSGDSDSSSENLKQKHNKGGNSLRHKSRLLQKFLPDTIKFTDTESESCEQPSQKTTRSRKLSKRSFDPDSDVFTIQDSQPINVHINHSKKKKMYGLLQTKQF